MALGDDVDAAEAGLGGWRTGLDLKHVDSVSTRTPSREARRRRRRKAWSRRPSGSPLVERLHELRRVATPHRISDEAKLGLQC